MTKPTPTREAEVTDSELRMDAYYFGFYATGVREIDLILCAVASAGKAYHHTDGWTEECRAYKNCEGKTPADWIQRAANNAGLAMHAARPVEAAKCDCFAYGDSPHHFVSCPAAEPPAGEGVDTDTAGQVARLILDHEWTGARAVLNRAHNQWANEARALMERDGMSWMQARAALRRSREKGE